MGDEQSKPSKLDKPGTPIKPRKPYKPGKKGKPGPVPWRIVDFETAEQDLKIDLRRHKTTTLNFVLIGQTGAGKSSLVNSIHSICEGRIVDIVNSKSDDLPGVRTHKFVDFPVTDNDLFQDIHIFDTMGFTSEPLSSYGISKDKLSATCQGRIEEDHTYWTGAVPVENSFENNVLRCVVIVVSAEDLERYTDNSPFSVLYTKMHTALPQEVSRIVIITKVDRVCEETNDDIRNMFVSKTVYDLVKKATSLFGTEVNKVFPIVNFCKEMEVDSTKSIPILYALKYALNYADNRQKHMEGKKGTDDRFVSNEKKPIVDGDSTLRLQQSETNADDVDGPVSKLDICDEIKDLCRSLKDEQGNEVIVVACRNQDGFELTVISNDREIDKEFIVKQCEKYDQPVSIDIRSVTDEGYCVMQSDEFMDCIRSDHYFEDIDKINTIIAKNSKQLYTDAQHVNSVFFSPVRSVGHMVDDHKILKEPCIVIYVDVKFDKGRVPIDCIEIPRWIEGVRTDVREGMAEFLVKVKSLPNEYNDPVTTGCQIEANQRIGTIGPIIDMGSNRVGFLTALHAVVPENLYLPCLEGSDIVDHIQERSVYQPVKDMSASGRHKVGCIEFPKGRKGCAYPREPGFEVALVEIQNRKPTDGGFTLYDFDNYNDGNSMQFTCGETISITNDNWKTMVEKFGAITGYTQSSFANTKPFQRLRMYGENSDPVDFAWQISIHESGDGRNSNPFAKPGDSGSLVLMKDNGQLKAVGILIGKSSDGTILVSPIEPICKELCKKGWSLKTFQA